SQKPTSQRPLSDGGRRYFKRRTRARPGRSRHRRELLRRSRRAAQYKAAERRPASAPVNGCHRRTRRRIGPGWGVVAVEQPRVRPESELFEPTFQRGPVDTNEVPTIAADHREARLVRPLIQDFLADLA